MKHLMRLPLIMCLLLVLIVSCTDESTSPPAEKIGKPTNLTLTRVSATSFTVSWVRAGNDKGNDVVTVLRTAPTAAQWQVNAASPTAILTFNDSSIALTGGQYTVTVASKDSTSNPASITLFNSVDPVPAPTNVLVNSYSATQIAVKWNRDFSEDGWDTVIATSASGTSSIALNSLSSEAYVVFDGLLPNVVYSISVASSTGHRSAPIDWATATRSGTITLFETAAEPAGKHSGLILGPTARTASVTGSDKDIIDVVLATDNSSPYPNLSLQGADVAGSGLPSSTRKTRFGNVYYIVNGGLNNDFYSGSFASEIKSKTDPTAVNYFGEFAGIHSESIILLARTADGHHARIEIVPQTGGSQSGYYYKQVTIGGQTYFAIDVIVSYQPIANVGYASRPFTSRGVVPRVGGASRVAK